MLLSKRNRSGILWLILVALVIAFLPRIISSFNRSPDSLFTYTDVERFEEEIDLKKSEIQKSEEGNKGNSRYQIPKSKFDPNEYSLQDWVGLGLSSKQAEVILKFTQRTIYSNEELKRIFVLPDELYELIKDSTYYPVSKFGEEDQNRKEKDEVLVDLNVSNEEELMKIPGIGPFYAKKIVEHRNALGGYIGREQLLEIWKFDQEKLSNIEKYIFLSEVNLSKMNINSASFNELKSHPYVDYSVANSIVKMREQSKFSALEDVLRSKLIDRELFEKIKPYITLDK